MNRLILKLSLFLAYLVLMLVLLDFNIALIIDIKLALFVAIGTAILILIDKLKGYENTQLKRRIRWHIFMTGCITTFLSQLSLLVKPEKAGDLIEMVIYNFLPLFYAAIGIIAVDLVVEKEKENEKGDRPARKARSLDQYPLTPREKTIAHALMTNMSNREIADKYFISENTVKKHVNKVYRKTGADNRT